MKVAVLTSPEHIEIQDRDIPMIGKDDILVQVRHVGICGSDLAYYRDGRIGSQIVKYPMVLGHECSGEIVKVGTEVGRLRVGDLVALEPQRCCGKCRYCRTGLYNLCPTVVFMATPPNDGAFAEYVAHPEAMSFKISPEMGTVRGALVEPLSIGVHVSNQASAGFGKSILILGAGCVGLSSLLALKAIGIPDLIVTDVLPKRLELARELGAKAVFDANKPDLVSSVLGTLGGEGADIVIETSGSELAIEQTVSLVRRGGIIVLVGYSKREVSFDFRTLIMKEAYISTSRRYRHAYPIAIRMISEGLASVDPLVTHHFHFEDVAEAFSFAVNNRGQILKGIVDFTK